MKKLFVLCQIASAIIVTGCGTPGLVKNPPDLATNTVTGNSYIYGTPPRKTLVQNEGREWKRHIKETQKAALLHERTMAEIEYAGKEKAWTEHNGLKEESNETSTTQMAAQEQPALTYPYYAKHWHNWDSYGGRYGYGNYGPRHYSSWGWGGGISAGFQSGGGGYGSSGFRVYDSGAPSYSRSNAKKPR